MGKPKAITELDENERAAVAGFPSMSSSKAKANRAWTPTGLVSRVTAVTGWRPWLPATSIRTVTPGASVHPARDRDAGAAGRRTARESAQRLVGVRDRRGGGRPTPRKGCTTTGPRSSSWRGGTGVIRCPSVRGSIGGFRVAGPPSPPGGLGCGGAPSFICTPYSPGRMRHPGQLGYSVYATEVA